MREIERLYSPLITQGLHKFKDSFNLADKDERMRNGGKGKMGEASYILIIPLVFAWWRVWVEEMSLASVVLSKGEFDLSAASSCQRVGCFSINAPTTRGSLAWRITGLHVSSGMRACKWTCSWHLQNNQSGRSHLAVVNTDVSRSPQQPH